MDEQSQGMQGQPVPEFQPQKALRPDMGYNTLANFRIEKKIGRGQFSEVYRAACLLDGVPVALKKVQVCLGPICGKQVWVLNAGSFSELLRALSPQHMALTSLSDQPTASHGPFAKA
uniref:NEK6-subfamily protein kinase n=1 Tax=Rhinolophus ferrumequinum TaxID=59479 RepID=A0A671FFI1_RHIFE